MGDLIGTKKRKGWLPDKAGHGRWKNNIGHGRVVAGGWPESGTGRSLWGCLLHALEATGGMEGGGNELAL